MDSIAIHLAELFEFMQPFCSAAMRKQAAFESAPLVKPTGSSHTLATETDMTHHDGSGEEGGGYGVAAAGGGPGAVPSSSFAKVQYLTQTRCDTSLTSSISEDEMFYQYFPTSISGPIPETVTFFTPKNASARTRVFSHLSLQWHVKRSVQGIKGIDEWTGRLTEVVDARQDTDGYLGYVTCYRISPSLVLPSSPQELQALQALHPTLAALAQFMKDNLTLPPLSPGSLWQAGGFVAGGRHYQSQQQPQYHQEESLFGLPLVLLSHVQVTSEYRGVGLGLLLVDETCRCLANPAQWVLIERPEHESLRDYFALLGFTSSGMLDGQVIIRWNDPHCMATHRYEDLCPHLPRVAIQ